MGEVWIFSRSTYCKLQSLHRRNNDLLILMGSSQQLLLLLVFPLHSGVAEKEHSEVLQVVESVKMQQQGVMEKLQMEQNQLEEELDGMALHEMVGSGMISDIVTDTGIPDEAYTLECPDEHLKMTVLEEFLLLDKKYEAQLEYLNIKYRHSKQLVQTLLINMSSFGQEIPVSKAYSECCATAMPN